MGFVRVCSVSICHICSTVERIARSCEFRFINLFSSCLLFRVLVVLLLALSFSLCIRFSPLFSCWFVFCFELNVLVVYTWMNVMTFTHTHKLFNITYHSIYLCIMNCRYCIELFHKWRRGKWSICMRINNWILACHKLIWYNIFLRFVEASHGKVNDGHTHTERHRSHAITISRTYRLLSIYSVCECVQNYSAYLLRACGFGELCVFIKVPFVSLSPSASLSLLCVHRHFTSLYHQFATCFCVFLLRSILLLILFALYFSLHSN